jgi:hypothetical protein
MQEGGNTEMEEGAWDENRYREEKVEVTGRQR